jgi:hypothetical protein
MPNLVRPALPYSEYILVGVFYINLRIDIEQYAGELHISISSTNLENRNIRRCRIRYQADFMLKSFLDIGRKIQNGHFDEVLFHIGPDNAR